MENIKKWVKFNESNSNKKKLPFSYFHQMVMIYWFCTHQGEYSKYINSIYNLISNYCEDIFSLDFSEEYRKNLRKIENDYNSIIKREEPEIIDELLKTYNFMLRSNLFFINMLELEDSLIDCIDNGFSIDFEINEKRVSASIRKLCNLEQFMKNSELLINSYNSIRWDNKEVNYLTFDLKEGETMVNFGITLKRN